ncbi:MAG: trypsin-like peptidase domain-containing protein [Pseudomonadota bacterium]
MGKWTSIGVRFASVVTAATPLLCMQVASAAEEVDPDVTTQAPRALAATAPAPSNRIAPEIMKAIRAATFEVVLKKPQSDPLQYDKPLPLEMLPFSQRNDKYESIGTAFAIAPDTFVTAGHVTSAASGSMWGIPALRDAQGNVYPIDRVTRYSMSEDFIVFTLSGAPRVVPLQTSAAFQIDTPVLAVGNALGQGIVARDGILTSETPEEQDGRWKWLRFSAPASPGNSGGPLLDAQGRVIGLISRKSANENLNYALPIAIVMNAAEGKASIDSRYTVSVPFMSARKVVKLQTEFKLPLPFADFDRKLITIIDQNSETEIGKLMQTSAADIFPRGKSARLLADTFLSSNPSVITQQPDGSWDVPRNNPGATSQLGTDGSVWVNSQAGVTLFHIQYPSDLDVTKSRGDSKLLSEQLLKTMKIARTFGTESVRLTSLGDAGKPEIIKDDFGRVWQQWHWSMPYADATMILMALPTPDGYAGFLRSSRGNGHEATNSQMLFLFNLLQVSYSGSLAQWRAFLADEHLRPENFGRWKVALDPAAEVSIEMPRLSVRVDKNVLNVSDRSRLLIFPGTLMEGDRPMWDVLGLQISLEPRRSASIIALRRSRPAPESAQGVSQRWANMTQLTGQYNGSPLRDANHFWVRKVIGAEGTPPADAKFLYDLSYDTPAIVVQGEVPRAAPRLPEMFAVHER